MSVGFAVTVTCAASAVIRISLCSRPAPPCLVCSSIPPAKLHLPIPVVSVARVCAVTAARFFPKIISLMSLCLSLPHPKLWHWLNKQVKTRGSGVCVRGKKRRRVSSVCVCVKETHLVVALHWHFTLHCHIILSPWRVVHFRLLLVCFLSVFFLFVFFNFDSRLQF